VVAAERLGRGNESGHLAAAAIEHEGDVDALATLAPNLEAVRAAAQTWLERSDDAVVPSASAINEHRWRSSSFRRMIHSMRFGFTRSMGRDSGALSGGGRWRSAPLPVSLT